MITLKLTSYLNPDILIHDLIFFHQAILITLLGQAMAQFKIYKCLRFRKKLAIDMAEEYLKIGDSAKALTSVIIINKEI